MILEKAFVVTFFWFARDIGDIFAYYVSYVSIIVSFLPWKKHKKSFFHDCELKQSLYSKSRERYGQCWCRMRETNIQSDPVTSSSRTTWLAKIHAGLATSRRIRTNAKQDEAFVHSVEEWDEQEQRALLLLSSIIVFIQHHNRRPRILPGGFEGPWEAERGDGQEVEEYETGYGDGGGWSPISFSSKYRRISSCARRVRD